MPPRSTRTCSRCSRPRGQTQPSRPRNSATVPPTAPHGVNTRLMKRTLVAIAARNGHNDGPGIL